MSINRPLKVNLDNLTWGAMEDLEALEAARKSGQRINVKQFVDLCTGILDGWTREDVRQVTVGETPQILEALSLELLGQVPKENTTNSSSPSSTEEPHLDGPSH